MPECIITKYTTVAAWTQDVKCGYLSDPGKALEDWAAGLIEIIDPNFPMAVVLDAYADLVNIIAKPLPPEMKTLLHDLRSSPLTIGMTWPSDDWLDTIRFASLDTVFGKPITTVSTPRGIAIGDTILLGDGIFNDVMSTPFPYPTVHDIECHYDDPDAHPSAAILRDATGWRESFQVLIEEIAHSVQYQTMGSSRFYTTRFTESSSGDLEDDARERTRDVFRDRALNRWACPMSVPPTVASTVGSTIVPLPGIIATQQLKLNDRARVASMRWSNCGYATPCDAPVEAGPGGANLGVQSTTGSVYSVGPVVLRGYNRINLGDVVSGAEVTVTGSAPAISYGTIQPHTTFQSHNLSNFAPVFPATRSPINPIPPDFITSINPGSYQWLTINARAYVWLYSGDYYFDGFQTEPTSVVRFATAQGPVRIFVKSSFMHKGKFEGDPESILVGYTGSNWINLEGKMLGTLIAPNGYLNVQGRNIVGTTEVTGEGALYAKYVELHQDALWVHRPFKYKWIP
jgi:hypothetical protein